MSTAIRGCRGLDTPIRTMRLLLLAGTPEAVRIGSVLAEVSGVEVISSLAYPALAPSANLPARVGPWSNERVLAGWLRTYQIDALLDATHPFSTGITKIAADACDALGIPFVRYLRPAWVPGPDDNWIFLNSGQDAARHIPEGDAVYLATGTHDLGAFEGLGQRPVYVRVRERQEKACPFPNGRYLFCPGDARLLGEMVALRTRGVKWIVARNSGGSWTEPVLEAARRLGLPVGMIRRPLQPEVPRIRTVPEAIDWVRRRI